MEKRTIELFGRQVEKEGDAIRALRVDDLTVAELVNCEKGLVQIRATIKAVETVSEDIEDVTYTVRSDGKVVTGIADTYDFIIRSAVYEVGSYVNRIGETEELHILATLLGAGRIGDMEAVLVGLELPSTNITMYIPRHRIGLVHNQGFIYSKGFLDGEAGQEHQQLDKSIKSRHEGKQIISRKYDMYGRKLIDTESTVKG
ncbi:hypothetical protein B4086_5517 [Bacillus cereus]|nr:hypothetical protein B4086_5517 [Bacillus cereus]